MARSPKWDAFRSLRRDTFAASDTASKGWWTVNFLKLLIMLWSHVSLVLGVFVAKAAILLLSSNLQPDIISCSEERSDLLPATIVHIGFALLLIQVIPDFCQCLQMAYRLMVSSERKSEVNKLFVLLELYRSTGLLFFYFFVSPALDPYRATIFVTAPILIIPSFHSTWSQLVAAFAARRSMNHRLRMLAYSVPPYYAVMTALTSVLLWSIIDVSFWHMMKYLLVVFLLAVGSWEYWIDEHSNSPVFRSLYEVKFGLRRLSDSTRLVTCLLRMLMAYFLFDILLRSRQVDYDTAVEIIVGIAHKSSAADRNVIFFGLSITALNFAMRWSSRFLAAMGLSVTSILNPLFVAPPLIAGTFALVCRITNICWINKHLSQFSLQWPCAKWSEADLKYTDHHLILLMFLVYSVWVLVQLFRRQGPSRNKTENVIDSMSPMISPLSIEASTEVYHYLVKREDKREEYESDDSMDDEFYDYLTLYICATMWHETKTEMTQMIRSILSLDEEQERRRIYRDPSDGVNFKLEVHIFFDDAWETLPECGRVPNAYFKQLFELLVELTLVAEDVVAECQRILVTTPYGGRLVMQLPAGTLLFVHLKDKKLLRHKKRWSQVMYMYYLLGHRIMDSHLPIEDRQHSADNTFIMAIDGDSKFSPDSIVRLLNLMKTKSDIGCACGRIHPIGNGLMVWYQKFEYAIGHWFQKAAEHVFGCVLCAPGCFSMFRGSALMDDNIMHKYTKTATDPKHFVQYDQGEDRWLSTLLLKQGYRIEYDAASYAETFAPEGFEEFFNQRRRWTPSSVANTLDLLADYKNVCDNNDNVSYLYIFYQMLVIGLSMLGPAIMFSMLVSAQVAAFGASDWFVIIANAIPVCLFVVACFRLQSSWQLKFAKVISIGYAFIMLAVLVATLSQIVLETAISPTSIFVLSMVFIYFAAALLHPHEFYNIMFGPVFFLMIPATYIFLSLYSLINLNVINWGTREAAEKALNEDSGPDDGDDIHEDRNNWMDSEYLYGCAKGRLKPSEDRFWCELIEKYLKPIKITTEETHEQAKGLADLRNKVSFSILLMNGLLVLAIFLLQKHKEVLSIKWLPYEGFQWTKLNEMTGKFETTEEALKVDPLGVGIVFFLMAILVVQSAGLLIHRLNTLVHAMHEAAKVERIFVTRRDENIKYAEIMASVRAMIDSESYERDAHGTRGYKRPPAKTKGATSKVCNVLYKLERDETLPEEDENPNAL